MISFGYFNFTCAVLMATPCVYKAGNFLMVAQYSPAGHADVYTHEVSLGYK